MATNNLKKLGNSETYDGYTVTAPMRQKKKNSVLLWVLPGLLLSSLIVIGIWPRLQQKAEFTQQDTNGIISLEVIQAGRAPANSDIILPATIRPFRETALHARTTGYVKRRLADIGDRVSAGQLLLFIETPEISQLLVEARANRELSLISLERAQSVAYPGAVARQDLDGRRASLAVNEAEVHRLQALESFQQITAPFDGNITARNVEVGQLVTADNAGSPELFHLSQTDSLKVYVNVPQSYTTYVQQGALAEVLVPEFPERVFAGRVARTAGALDPLSHTLLCEVYIPNHERMLMPGIFAQVKFKIQRSQPPVLIPANTIVVNGEGTQVITVTPEKRLHYQLIVLGRDVGGHSEVISGLTGTEVLVVNPTDDLYENQPIVISNPSALIKATHP